MSKLVSKEAEKIRKAFDFANEKHREQGSKSSDFPYIFHPVDVSIILKGMNCNTDLIIAGLLHDTVEDTDTTFEEIEKEFGTKVVEYVKSDTEDKSKSWEERKAETIKSLKDMDLDCKKLILADKLSNIRCSYNNLKYSGDKNIWGAFKRGKDQQRKYYTDICNGIKELCWYEETREYYLEFLTLIGKVFQD